MKSLTNELQKLKNQGCLIFIYFFKTFSDIYIDFFFLLVLLSDGEHMKSTNI